MTADRQGVVAYVSLGANLGDAESAVTAAMGAIDHLEATRVTQRSGLYRSAPVQASGPDFVNAVVEVTTTLTAPDLLRQLQQLERMAGRERPYPNAPRTLDLDLLLFGSASISSAELTIPHPRMSERAFVLQPLAEIAHGQVDMRHLLAVADQAIVRI